MDAQDPAATGGSSGINAPGAESSADVSPPTATPPEPEAAAAPELIAPPAFPPPPDHPAPFAVAAPAVPKRRGRSRLVIGIVALVLVVLLVGGGIVANAQLSSTYSPERAVTDYFAAQARGDVSAMMANATFQVGTNPELFNRTAIVPMMDVSQNKDVQNVKVVSSQAVDSSTQSVAVSMTWAGKPHNQTYTVRKDSSQTHVLFYHSWKIEIPFVTIHITLPNQPGVIAVDGIVPQTQDVSAVQAIEGYHNIIMRPNFLYDVASQVVDGVEGSPTAAFAPPVSPTALALAAAAVKQAFPNCDATKYSGCLNHTYSAPPGQYFEDTIPGYGVVDFTTYMYTLVGDPTTGMKVDVPTDAGKLDAAGGCRVTLTLDGNRNYSLQGVWGGVLTWNNGAFVANLTSDCGAARA